MIDSHFHTSFSIDSREPLVRMVEAAVSRGIWYVTPTEHVDFDPTDVGFGYYDDRRYSAAIESVRCSAPKEIEVLKGVEVDYQHRHHDEVVAFLQGGRFDFVIGSVHYPNGAYVFDDAFLSQDERVVCEVYFDELLRAARSGLFDVLGHFDILKRFGVRFHGPFRPERYADLIDPVLQACVETGTGLEINTSGWRQPPGEPFPNAWILRRYRELGGEVITVGSDAHSAVHVGFGVRHALEMARRLGFRAVAVFRDREPEFLPLG